MIYLQLFMTFFKIGLFSFGGGYAMLSLIQKEVVVVHRWITVGEFADIVAVSQITPGPIAINSATYIGYVASKSIFGSICATFGVVLPSIVVMGILIIFLKKFKDSKFIDRAFKGLRYVVIGLILGAALSLINHETFIDATSYILFVLALMASLWFKMGPIPLTIAAGICGFIFYY